MIQYIFPSRIVAASEVNVDNLLKKQTLQIGLAERQTVTFHNGGFVILDFGKETCGGVRILTAAAENVPVRIRFGESLSEACSELGGEKNATNDHSLRDLTVHLQNLSDMSFGQTGFRFVRLDFFGEVRLKCVAARSEIAVRRSVYTYEGSDARIKEIFETAKRTVDLCTTSGYIWDGIKRDRLVWIGDMAPEVLALTTMYGRLPCIERSLDFVKEQTPLPGWMNDYPMYSMWWIIILDIYLERANAHTYVEKQMSYLAGLLSQMDGCILENGALAYPSYFVDWPTHDTPEELAGVRAINIMALKSACKLLTAFGKDTALAEKMLAKLKKIEICAKEKKQVLALKYFAVGLSEEEKALLVEGGAEGMSTFMSYYILKAVASFDKPKAIEMMKEYYGAMLDKGATTFWEDFNIEWTKNSGRIDAFTRAGEKDIHGDFGAFCYVGFRHSLCHGWSAGVIAFIKEENIG